MIYNQSKYRNQRICVDGRWFDSKREARRFKELQLLERAGEISDLKTQVPFLLIPKQPRKRGKPEQPCQYIADFTYTDKGGEYVVEDAKGKQTPEYIIKRKLMLKEHGIEIREV